jgi:hypothetical protein
MVLFLGLYRDGEKISRTENNLLLIREDAIEADEDTVVRRVGLRSVSARRAINRLLYSNRCRGLNSSADAALFVVFAVAEVTQDEFSSSRSSSNETRDDVEEEEEDEVSNVRIRFASSSAP